MSRRVSSPSPEAKDTLRALRRAAKNALELGLRTGTPVYVVKNGEIVDLTKQRPSSKKSKTKRAARKSVSIKR
jgi:hypothetical protein